MLITDRGSKNIATGIANACYSLIVYCFCLIKPHEVIIQLKTLCQKEKKKKKKKKTQQQCNSSWRYEGSYKFPMTPSYLLAYHYASSTAVWNSIYGLVIEAHTAEPKLSLHLIYSKPLIRNSIDIMNLKTYNIGANIFP